MATKGIYIYGIVPNFYVPDHFRSIKNSGLSFISLQNISAIISDREKANPDFSDRESLAHLLVHHQRTIEEIMASGFNMILPMKLGTIVSSKKEVLTILARGYDLIIETLKKIEFQIEIDIAVTWADFLGTLQDIATHPDIVAMKNDILKNIDKLSQLDQVKIGMLVQEKLEKKNKQVELDILNALSPFSVDIKIHEVMNDQMITNSAFLVHRNKKEKFEQVIDQLDEEYKGLLNFKLVGPLPCYSFYTAEVDELNLDYVAQAKKELGLNEELSESEIKKAYLGKAKLFHPDAEPIHGAEENFNRINKAYHTMLDYSKAAKQSVNDEYALFANDRVDANNLLLIKIRE